MAKRYDESIDVTPDPVEPDAPVSFSWRGRRYDIDERLSSWREAGEWWQGRAAREREYYRVLARPSGALATGDLDPDGFMVTPSAVYDIYRDRINDVWRMARLWD
ncbi:MAG TPA: DUF6504 family protein [Actinomycetota bacterium]|nr:DUF6504 family protein [Actinomycetota bacterium]